MKLYSFLTFFVIMFSLLASPVLAQNLTQIQAGTTPDSFLYGLDVLIDNLRLLIATAPESKAKLSLEIAQERLLEVKAMVEVNKLPQAQRAQSEHTKVLTVAETSIDRIEKTNATEEIKSEIQIEKRLKDHREQVESISGELKIKIKVKGEITAEQQALVKSILDSMEGKTGEVEIKIDNEKQETKIKIKQQTGKSDEEIEDEVEELELESGVEELDVEAEIVNGQAQVEVEREFNTITLNRSLIIDEIISTFTLDRETANATLEIETGEELEQDRLKVEVKIEEGVAEVEVELRFTLNTTDRDAILDAIVSRTQLTREQIEAVLKFETEEEEEEELKIEVEIEEGMAKVEVEFNGEDLEFVLETTDRNEIIAAIAEKTGLTTAQIESVLELEIEEEEEGLEEESEELETEEEEED